MNPKERALFIRQKYGEKAEDVVSDVLSHLDKNDPDVKYWEQVKKELSTQPLPAEPTVHYLSEFIRIIM
jgi:hypothetical protein